MAHEYFLLVILINTSYFCQGLTSRRRREETVSVCEKSTSANFVNFSRILPHFSRLPHPLAPSFYPSSSFVFALTITTHPDAPPKNLLQRRLP